MALDISQVYTKMAEATSARESDLESTLKLDLNKPENLGKMQAAMQKWTMMQQLQSQTVKEVGEAMKGIIQKMG